MLKFKTFYEASNKSSHQNLIVAINDVIDELKQMKTPDRAIPKMILDTLMDNLLGYGLVPSNPFYNKHNVKNYIKLVLKGGGLKKY